MNILILSNGAPNYHCFFNSLAIKLKEHNHNVSFAVDCKTSFEENKIRETRLPNKIFSDYFYNHEINHGILDKYKKYNINSALLSDYERAMVYKIWGRRDNDFYEKLKSALLCYFLDIFEKNNIQIVFYENVSNSFAHFCWLVCQEKGVKYIGLTSSRLPNRFWITDDPCGEHLKISAMLKKISSGEITPSNEVTKWCEDYIDKIDTITPDYMKFNNLDNTNILKRYFKYGKIKKIFIGLRHFFDDHYHSYQRGNPLFLSFHFFMRNVYRKLKIKRIRKLYSSVQYDDKYILYPLHFHPESSTSILSGSYLDEFEVIRNIAFNLPQGIKLYVKDHVSAFGYPSMDFYTKLINLPNVRVLPPEAPTKKLIRESLAVITLTSTVGYEALLLNKKVFLLGQVFYQDHKNVIKVENPSKLYNCFQDVLFNETPELLEENKKYNIKFIVAYYECTLSGSLNLVQEKTKAKKLVDILYDDIMDFVL